MPVIVNNRNLLTDEDLKIWERDGYAVVRGLWSPEEVAQCQAAFDTFAMLGKAIPDQWDPDPSSERPWERCPRVMHPHRIKGEPFRELSLKMLLDKRVEAVVAALMGEAPIATQSMFYYKPPGSQGQALHQDNIYLQVRPKTCVAAWTAIDRSHKDNGGLYVCPGTQDLELQCPQQADAEDSYSGHYVPPPKGCEEVALTLEKGDVLFFNGSVIHGSKSNTTKDEWRRSLICHYAPASAKEINDFYRPSLNFDGSDFSNYESSSDAGGPCGDDRAFVPPVSYVTT
ncbi:MAG: phytanoyl-CoA dioxygenase family protein [Algisphaera sp.]